MKNSNLVFLILATMIHFLQAKQEEFKIILESKWENLENDAQRIKQFGGKWILAGSITFKKRLKEENINLSQLSLQWNGPHLDKITGSLYEKNSEKKFYPIEEFHICEGIWSKKQNMLIFQFDPKWPLQAVNTFYLVLTVPPEQEELLKQGSFCIAPDCLPNQLQEHMNTQDLSLSFNMLSTKIIVASH